VFDSLRKDCIGAYDSPPWGKVHTPNFKHFAEESLVMTRAFPESLPTLQARRTLYTGRRVYPFHDSNLHLTIRELADGQVGWGPIPEEQPTLAELLRASRYRTGLIADVYHMFKPSHNYWRGFDQWTFLRGQEMDPARSGPWLTQDEIDYWLPKEIQNDKTFLCNIQYIQRCITNMRDRVREEDYFSPRVLKEAALWLEQNQDTDKFFLTVESFDPHEPWLVPEHYRRIYLSDEGREQVTSFRRDISNIDPKLIARTQANYSGNITMCDRWFGFFMDTLKAQGRLDNTMVILTADHGHSVGDRDFMGKLGYPSVPEVFEIPLMIRFPRAEHAGTRSNQFVQHHDISALILEAAEVEPPAEIEGISFLESAPSGEVGQRDHVTVGWGLAVTVINDRWWLNCKVDGTGVLLYDLKATEPFASNVAQGNPDIVNGLFALAKEDAGGSFPDWLFKLVKKQANAAGCTDLVAHA
jgi:arylsulfatase A-like enzyme